MANKQAEVYIYVLNILKNKRKVAVILLILCLLLCRRVKDKLILQHRIGKTEELEKGLRAIHNMSFNPRYFIAKGKGNI